MDCSRILAFCFLAALWGCCNGFQEKQGETAQSVDEEEARVLIVKNYDSIGDPPERAEYVFDGKLVGRGQAGIKALGKLHPPAGSKVTVECTWLSGPSGPPLELPPELIDLLNEWEMAGIVVDIEMESGGRWDAVEEEGPLK